MRKEFPKNHRFRRDFWTILWFLWLLIVASFYFFDLFISKLK